MLIALLIMFSTSSTIDIKNTTLAIYAAPEAIPPKPKIAAINAITRNVIDSLIIIYGFIGSLI